MHTIQLNNREYNLLFQDCPKCKGQGWIREGVALDMRPPQLSCPECGGSGNNSIEEVIRGDKCTMCEASGFLELRTKSGKLVSRQACESCRGYGFIFSCSCSATDDAEGTFEDMTIPLKIVFLAIQELNKGKIKVLRFVRA
jgi:DnaJ-class molecular chaperone